MYVYINQFYREKKNVFIEDLIRNITTWISYNIAP